MGALDKGSDRYDTASQELSFDLLDDKGGRIRSPTGGSSPATSRTPSRSSRSAATQTGRIEAEKLLVKCPSKYQGAEVEKAYASKARPGNPLLMFLARRRRDLGPPWSAGLACVVTYWRVDRGREDLLPLARSLYSAYRDRRSSPPPRS